mmetsp:Transcript_10337/g.15045  ORF Transcript_10337/g.15045 Transcript_10337/m.15045 type:complete len:80 (+) Transcript_10337:678-917(+)
MSQENNIVFASMQSPPQELPTPNLDWQILLHALPHGNRYTSLALLAASHCCRRFQYRVPFDPDGTAPQLHLHLAETSPP